METKYLKYTLEGEHSAEDARCAIGRDAAPQGLVVRVDSIDGQTQLYIAVTPVVSEAISEKKAALPDGVKVEEVSVNDVTKFSDL